MTGTPFANGMSNFVAALRFLELHEIKHPHLKIGTGGGFDAWAMHDVIVQNFFWRNTKASIADEYVVPDVVEELLMLDMVCLIILFIFVFYPFLFS